MLLAGALGTTAPAGSAVVNMVGALIDAPDTADVVFVVVVVYAVNWWFWWFSMR